MNDKELYAEFIKRHSPVDQERILGHLRQYEANVASLIRAADRGFAVMVVGGPATGKHYLCGKAAEEMGKPTYTIHASLLTLDDLYGAPYSVQLACGLSHRRGPGLLEKIPADAVVIVEELHRSNLIKEIGAVLTGYLRSGGRPSPGHKRAVFITIPSDVNHQEVLPIDWYGSATGETIGLERLVVEGK